MTRARDRRIARTDDAPQARDERAPSIPAGATPREVAELIRGAGGDHVGLMRSLGNQLARQVAAHLQDDLPAAADNLRLYRDGVKQLRALVAKAPPGADWAAAVGWLTDVTTTMKLVAPIADGSMLVFESQVVPDHDAEYGTASSDIRRLVPQTLATVVPLVRGTGTALRDGAVSGINASSIARRNGAADPALPPLDQVTAWRQQATALHAVAKDVDWAGAGLAEAAGICEDAALAVLQAHAVVSARDTWRSGAAVETAANLVNTNRPRTEVDDIFADAGFNNRQSLKSPADVEDWCGMFVAAGMFRGAGFDKDMRMAFAHTDNVYDFFRYTAKVNDQRTPLSIWADGRWWTVRDYHAARSLPRHWVEGDAVRGADIRPGDVVLIRHKGTKPGDAVANHIVMVESYDAASEKLVTIEGNVMTGIRAGADGEAVRNADGTLTVNAAAQTSSVAHVRDLSDRSDPTREGQPRQNAGDPYEEKSGRTVFGIGRPSLVDFEDHEYAKQEVPVRFQTMSPAQIRAAGAGALLQQPSTLESPADSPYHRRVDG